MDTMTENGDWLIKHNPQIAKLVTERVEKHQESFDELVTKVEVRFNRLQNALLKSQQFETIVDEFNDTINSLRVKLDSADELNALFEPLTKLKADHEVGVVDFSCLLFGFHTSFVSTLMGLLHCE